MVHYASMRQVDKPSDALWRKQLRTQVNSRVERGVKSAEMKSAEVKTRQLCDVDRGPKRAPRTPEHKDKSELSGREESDAPSMARAGNRAMVGRGSCTDMNRSVQWSDRNARERRSGLRENDRGRCPVRSHPGCRFQDRLARSGWK
jgi:hypothetical protein